MTSREDFDESEGDERDFAERDFAERLKKLLRDDDEVRRVSTYDAAGVLTQNTGLVVILKDGSEFQITIVRA